MQQNKIQIIMQVQLCVKIKQSVMHFNKAHLSVGDQKLSKLPFGPTKKVCYVIGIIQIVRHYAIFEQTGESFKSLKRSGTYRCN